MDVAWSRTEAWTSPCRPSFPPLSAPIRVICGHNTALEIRQKLDRLSMVVLGLWVYPARPVPVYSICSQQQAWMSQDDATLACDVSSDSGD